jgi:hypothetical protein
LSHGFLEIKGKGLILLLSFRLLNEITNCENNYTF